MTEPSPLPIPEFCLVVLIGATDSDKSAFAREHFRPTEIISADYCRALLTDEESGNETAPSGHESNPELAADAFDIVAAIAEKRLSRRKLTVIDATNLHHQDRASLVALARRHYALPLAIVFDPGKGITLERAKLEKEGFRVVHDLRSEPYAIAMRVERQRLSTDRRDEHGPFDIVGDVHGCVDELIALMQKLGYAVRFEGTGETRRAVTTPPPGRRLCFIGDLVDRGPNSPDVLRVVMDMVAAGQALCVPGNHDVKLLRWLNGREVKMAHGIDRTIAQFAVEPASLKPRVQTFLDGLVSHIWLEGGRLALAHAGIREDMIGRASGAVREFCLYGETSGETDEFGLPIRYHWAAQYRGRTAIVYGHTPVIEAEWVNNTLCIDTGCCFGGNLTALRWPENEIVSVPAARVYSEPIRAFGHPPVRPPS